MFGFKTEEEKFKLADYDRIKRELESTQQSLVNCEKSRQDWIDFANDLQEENRRVVVFETWQRPDGSIYMTSRKKNKQEFAADKAAMLNECVSDWKKVWK